MKKLLIVLMTATIALNSTIVSFAGEWKQDSVGWWYQNDDGHYPSSSWKEIDGKQYYFDASGYMLHDTTTPDGYKVGSDGTWIKDVYRDNGKWENIKGYYVANERFSDPIYAEDELSHGVVVEKYNDDLYIIKQWADTERRYEFATTYAFQYVPGQSTYNANACFIFNDRLNYYNGVLTFTYDGIANIEITNDTGTYNPKSWNGIYSKQEQ